MITENSCSNMKIKTEIVSEDENCDQNNNNQGYNHGDNNNNNSELDFAKIAENRTATARKLFSIIKKGDFDDFILMLSTKPDLNVFINGQTALHHCLLQGRDVSWCRQLVINGANPNLCNQDGWHPLHLAALKGLTESLTYLITCNRKAFDE
ncbi:notch-regulated ankyrin repeat-containing protein B-like [Brevipalpus obovatus]|uniref:notch-regulated ankyrin repeat-containing protein B-like n=1 Tax=Brevipalpus obovatus TaxID=246614 RepID=UPI003D9E4BC7